MAWATCGTDGAGNGPERDPEGGSASVLAVSGIGVLALLAMLGLGTRAVVERRAVEDSIAEMRAYWAAMGISTYALSRVRYDTTNGAPAEAFAKAAIQEVADGTAGTELLTTWRYPDVSASYVFVVNPDNPTNDGGPTQPGEVGLCYHYYTAAGAPQSLRTIPVKTATLKLRSVEFKYCMISAAGAACGNAPPAGNKYTLQRIRSVHRPSGACS